MRFEPLTPPAIVQKETPEDISRRIEIENHQYCASRGQNYGCQFCGKESLAILWGGIAGNTCPLCKREYDWMMAQDMEE